MKTILFLFHVSSIGGGSYCLLNILKEIDRTCLRPIVLLKNEGPLADEIRKLGIAVFFLPSLTQVPYNRSLCRLSSVKAYVGVKKSLEDFSVWLKDTDVDIIYINTMMLYPYLKVAKQLGKKTVIHIRECWPKNEHKKQLKWAQDAIVKYADQIVAINQRSAAIVPLAKDKTTIVYDWIDFTERYKYMPFDDIFCEDCSNLKVYLFTGGMQRIKGAYEVVKTFTTQVKDSRSRLLFIGYEIKKDTSTRYKIKKFLSLLGIKSYEIKVRELIESDNRIRCIKGFYEIKHIIEQSYCLLSYFSIPHANLALAESIILHTPVIAASTSESLEYSHNGTLACLFRMNDERDFIDKVKNFSAVRDELLSKMSDASDRVKELFDRKRNSQELHKVYNKLFEL